MSGSVAAGTEPICKRLLAVARFPYNRHMRIVLGLASVLLVSALTACSSRPAARLDHEAYIWQRQWTPALAAAIGAMRGDFAGWRVLAAESTPAGELTDAAPQLDLLARSGKPVIAVLRLNGSQPSPATDLIAKRIAEIIVTWRAAGVPLRGIEIDHDCATDRLDAYATLLERLRASMPRDVRLSITALPTWIGASALPRVLAQVDGSVLQVHAIAPPRSGQGAAGLFDGAQAQRWIDAYSAIAGTPFRVALPAYGVRVGFDESGRAMAVEGEMERTTDADSVRELRVDPIQVAALLRRLERTPPPRLVGILWFRLPSADDRRAWSAATLHAVIAGAPLAAEFVASATASKEGASDVSIANRGTLDAPLSASVSVVAKDCSAADALAGFRSERTDEGWRFFSQSDAILRAGHERRIGWVRCATIEKVFAHEPP